MFTEFQTGDGDELDASARFYATQADNDSERFVMARQNLGPVRLWGFDDDRAEDRPIPAFPATDEPFTEWYDELMRSAGAVDWQP
jgi:hypothetical protein